MSSDDTNKIELSTMLSALRTELFASQQEAKDKAIKFKVEDVELEIQLAVAKEDKIGAGVKFWVLNASGDFKETSQVTHKIKLKLKPETASGDSIKVNAVGDR